MILPYIDRLNSSVAGAVEASVVLGLLVAGALGVTTVNVVGWGMLGIVGMLGGCMDDSAVYHNMLMERGLLGCGARSVA